MTTTQNSGSQEELFPGFNPNPGPPRIMDLHGESRDGIGFLEGGIVAWEMTDGIWWMSSQDGRITGYNTRHYMWLSLRPEGSED